MRAVPDTPLDTITSAEAAYVTPLETRFCPAATIGPHPTHDEVSAQINIGNHGERREEETDLCLLLSSWWARVLLSSSEAKLTSLVVQGLEHDSKLHLSSVGGTRSRNVA